MQYEEYFGGNTDIKKNEEDFQDAWNKYWHQETSKKGQKAQWERMWKCISVACANICKSILKKRGVIRDDLDELILDSTAYCMKFIGNGVHPKKLSAYCYLRCFRFINDPNDIAWNEHIINASEWYENINDNGEIVVDD